MTDIIKHTVRNLGEYLKVACAINRNQSERTWFRGHSSAAHRLLPSVLRDTIPLADQFGRGLKGGEHLSSSGYTVTGLNPERMLEEFKRKARPFLEFIPSNDFEWLFLMQHYGVPTRLLDWTTNALVALYFATEFLSPKLHTSKRGAAAKFMSGSEIRDDGFAIYAIDPEQINQEAHGSSCAIDICSDGKWSGYARPMEAEGLSTYSPVCVLAPHNNPRIRAQSGTFTLHGSNIWPLDYYDALRPLIHKIFVPYEYTASIRGDLSAAGMTTSFIYPDLAGLSREIKLAEMRRHSIDRKVWLQNLPSTP